MVTAYQHPEKRWSMKTVSTALYITLSFATTSAFAASAAYNFTTLDIAVPGQPNLIAFPDDLNDKGEILANIRTNNLSQALIVQKPPTTKSKAKFSGTSLFSCTGIAFADTSASSINRSGEIAGSCADAPSAPSKVFGFVRYKDGSHVLLDFPGSDGTMAFGLSDDGKVVGQFYGPLRTDHGGALSYRFHCFIWDKGEYRQLDFPRDNTYVSCSSITKRGQVLGEYITVNLNNEYLEHGFFIYENGNFSVPFPLSYLHIGGPWTYLSDMNNKGTVIGIHSANDGTPDQLVLYDDDKFYDIALPSGWFLVDVGGINNKGEFVGRYAIQVGIDPFYGSPIYAHHGFLATPASPLLAAAK